MSTSSRKVVISEFISPDLALRYNAGTFFDYLDSLPQSHVIIDFKKVRTVTRSFAQEYNSRKTKSQKIFSEINIPKNVRMMFDIVETISKKTKLVDFEKRKTTVLTI